MQLTKEENQILTNQIAQEKDILQKIKCILKKRFSLERDNDIETIIKSLKKDHKID